MPLPAHYFATAGAAGDSTDAGQQMHPAVLQHLLQQQQQQQLLAMFQLQQGGAGANLAALGGYSSASGASLAPPPAPLYAGAPLMQSPLAATAALQQLQQQLPIGAAVAARSESASSTSASSSVENTQPPSSPPSTSRSTGDCKDAVRLHISNIPYKWRNPDLEKLFAPHGEVIEAEVIFNERGSKGFGFITMATKEGADAAKAAIHQQPFENRIVEVNPATMKMSGRQKAKVLQATNPHLVNPHMQLAMLQQLQPAAMAAAADPQMALQQLFAAQAILAQYSAQQQMPLQQMLQGLQQPAMQQQQQWLLQQQLSAAAAPTTQLDQHQRRMAEEMAKQQRYRPY